MGRHKSDESATEISELRVWLGQQFHEVHEKFETQQNSLLDIKHQLEELEVEAYNANATCEELKKENSALRDDVSNLKWQLEHLDAYIRKDNLRFYNIPERQSWTSEQVLRDFIDTKLRLNTDDIDFSTVHRIGQPNKGSRCIIARFVKRSDVEKVKAGAVRLRGSAFGIADDLPPSWAEKRKQAYNRHIKPARAEKKKIRWRGNQLYIDDKEVDLTSSTSPSTTTPTSTPIDPGPGPRPSSSTSSTSSSSSTSTLIPDQSTEYQVRPKEQRPPRNTDRGPYNMRQRKPD